MDKILFHPEFVTATIYNWLPLLKSEESKEIICASLKFLVDDNRIILHAYCIMDNHIHLIWQVKGKWKSSDIKRDFLKYTAHQLKENLSLQSYRIIELLKMTEHSRSGNETHFPPWLAPPPSPWLYLLPWLVTSTLAVVVSFVQWFV